MNTDDYLGALILCTFFANVLYMVDLQILYRYIRNNHRDDWERLGRPDLIDNNNARVLYGFLSELFSGRINEIEGLASVQGARMLRIKIILVLSLVAMSFLFVYVAVA